MVLLFINEVEYTCEESVGYNYEIKFEKVQNIIVFVCEMH